MSETSTRSGSPSSSEATVSRRGSVDTADLDRGYGIAAGPAPVGNGTPPQPAPAMALDAQPCPVLAATAPVRPKALSSAAVGDASQREPVPRLSTPAASPTKTHSTAGLSTPVASPTKRHGLAGLSTPLASPTASHGLASTCGGGQLLLPIGGFFGNEPFQPSPAGTPTATPAARFTASRALTSTSPSSSSGVAVPSGLLVYAHAPGVGDASARTPLASPMASQSIALTSWLCGSPAGRLPSGPELTEILRAALPEAYDD